jgi:hypothetical protein
MKTLQLMGRFAVIGILSALGGCAYPLAPGYCPPGPPPVDPALSSAAGSHDAATVNPAPPVAACVQGAPVVGGYYPSYPYAGGYGGYGYPGYGYPYGGGYGYPYGYGVGGVSVLIGGGWGGGYRDHRYGWRGDGRHGGGFYHGGGFGHFHGGGYHGGWHGHAGGFHGGGSHGGGYGSGHGGVR